MGVKISKRYSSHSYGTFSTKHFLKTSLKTVLTKFTSWQFEILNLKLKKKRLKFSLTWGPIGAKTLQGYSSYNYDSFSTQNFSECSL